jgi:hypothetical protein
MARNSVTFVSIKQGSYETIFYTSVDDSALITTLGAEPLYSGRRSSGE